MKKLRFVLLVGSLSLLLVTGVVLGKAHTIKKTSAQLIVETIEALIEVKVCENNMLWINTARAKELLPALEAKSEILKNNLIILLEQKE